MNARVTILHDPAAPGADASRGLDPSDSFDATVLQLEQPLMQLATHRPLDANLALRIDTTDAVWLGEVERCVATGDGFSILVRLRHVLRDFETLARLAERFGMAAPKGTPVQF